MCRIHFSKHQIYNNWLNISQDHVGEKNNKKHILGETGSLEAKSHCEDFSGGNRKPKYYHEKRNRK